MEKVPYRVSSSQIGFYSLEEPNDSNTTNGETPKVVKGGLNTKKLVLIVGSVIAVGVIAAVGVGVGVAVLNKDDQGASPEKGTPPTPVQDPIDGEWTYWDKWSDCSATCGGGTQVRRRTCGAPPPLFGGKICPGKDIQTRECSKWTCPDCDRTCPAGGTLSKDCDVCLCKQEVLFGTVRDSDNMPLDGVDVYFSYKQWDPVATTNYWGEYRVQSLCAAATKLLFKKEGFMQNETMAVSLNATYQQANGMLRKYEKPRIETQPVNKYRFVGQAATLCCDATGFPAAMKYSWSKDGTQIAQDLSTGTLRLTNLQKSDQGTYACTAESVAGIVKSESVQVSVKDISEDTCDRYPVPKTEKLPAGCFVTVNGANENEIDIGQCVQLPCITSTDIDNGTCEEWWPSKCCNIETVERIEATCKNFSFTLNKVKTCGCSLGTLVTQITAFAYGIKNETRVPFQRGKVFVDGKQLLYSSSTGMIMLTVPFEKTEITLSFQEDIKGEFLDSIKTLKITPGKPMTVQIILPIRPIPTNFNTRIGLSIPLNNLDGDDEVATISIPSDSILDKNGNKYEGAANAFVNFMDPRKLEDLQTADGQFTTLDDNGNVAPLETFGMFRMHFEDTSGSELYLSGPITTQMDASLFNISQDKDGNPDLSMWHLDPNTGQWVEQGKFRYVQSQGKRRLLQNAAQMIEGTINPSSIPTITLTEKLTTTKTIKRPIYSNCDRNTITGYTYSRYVQTGPPTPKADACFVRVRAYTDFSLSDPLPGVMVTAVTKELSGPRFKGISRKATGDDGIACLDIFCNSMVYIYVTYSNRMYATDQHSLPKNYLFQNIQNLTQVKFVSTDPYTTQVRKDKMYSPVYDYYKQTQCTTSSFSDGYFQFAPIKKDDTLYRNQTDNNKRLSWYTRPVGHPLHRSCFIKLNIKSSIDSFDIIAKSFIQDDPSKHDEYGTYLASPYWDESTDNRYSKAACIEFRCPGLVVDGTTKTQNVPTLVFIHITSKQGARCTLDPRPAVNVVSKGFGGFQFLADPTDRYGQKYGVFMRAGDSRHVKQMCESGTLSGSITSSTMKPDKNPAFKLTCT